MHQEYIYRWNDLHSTSILAEDLRYQLGKMKERREKEEERKQ